MPLKHQSSATGEMNPVESEEMLHLLIAQAHFNGLPIPVFTLTPNAKETFWRDKNMDFYTDDPPVSVPGPREEERSRHSQQTERPPLPAFWEILQRIITNVVSFANTELRPIGEEIQRLFNTFEPDLQQSVQDHMSRLQQHGLEAAAQAAAKAREKNFRVCVGDKQFTLDNLFEALNLDVPIIDSTDVTDATEDGTEATSASASASAAPRTEPSRDGRGSHDLWRPRHAPGAHAYHPGSCRHNHGLSDEPKRRGDDFPNRSIRRSDIDTEVDTVIMEDDMVMGTSMDPVTPTSWVP